MVPKLIVWPTLIYIVILGYCVEHTYERNTPFPCISCVEPAQCGTSRGHRCEVLFDPRAPLWLHPQSSPPTCFTLLAYGLCLHPKVDILSGNRKYIHFLQQYTIFLVPSLRRCFLTSFPSPFFKIKEHTPGIMQSSDFFPAQLGMTWQ